MTPMQRFKTSFDEFKGMLPSNVEEVALNKSEDRTYVSRYCGDRQEHSMKGVRSDFVKYFKRQLSDENSHSLGFSFSYLDKPEGEQSVSVSLKVGNTNPAYFVGKPLSLEVFHEGFRKAMEDMENADSMDFLNVAEIFKSVFGLKQAYASAKKALSRKARRLKN